MLLFRCFLKESWWSSLEGGLADTQSHWPGFFLPFFVQIEIQIQIQIQTQIPIMIRERLILSGRGHTGCLSDGRGQLSLLSRFLIIIIIIIITIITIIMIRFDVCIFEQATGSEKYGGVVWHVEKLSRIMSRIIIGLSSLHHKTNEASWAEEIYSGNYI